MEFFFAIKTIGLKPKKLKIIKLAHNRKYPTFNA